MSQRLKRLIRTLVATSLLTATIGIAPASSAAPGDPVSTFAAGGGDTSTGVIYGLQPAKSGTPTAEDC
jgi:hypothetical protein